MPGAEPGSNLERLLNRKFSGDTEKMFNALQAQLKKKAVSKEDCVLKQGTNRAIYLRAFIKGLNLLRETRKNGSDLLKEDNLFNFSGRDENESRGVSLTPGALVPVGVPVSSRLPLPSLSSVIKHLSDYTEVKTIRSKHLRILKLDLEGIHSRKEIAQIIGCSEPTITNVLSSEAVQAFKRRALGQMEDEYSSLLNPAIAAVRDALHPMRDIGLRQDTAFKYLRTQGKGVEGVHQVEHRHTVTGKIEVSEVKQKMLQKLGYSNENIMEADFSEVSEAGD